MPNYDDLEDWMNRIFKLRPHWYDWQRKNGIQNVARRVGPMKLCADVGTRIRSLAGVALQAGIG